MDRYNWKNKNGTAGKTPVGYGSWLAFWEAKTGSKAGTCKVDGCVGSATVGAHICKNDSTEYITPMCSSCNMKSTSFTLKSATKIVRVSDSTIFTV